MESIRQAAERLTRNIGTLENVYEYRNPDGTLAFSNLRIMQSNGSKAFRMMSEVGDAFVLRRPEKPEQGWPLYGLLAVNANPDASVFVVEGEKDANALLSLNLVAVTSGSTSTASHADWSPLAGRGVILWPDNDSAGRKYMGEVTDLLESIGCSVEHVQVDALGLPEKGDCSDWLTLHPSAGADEVLSLARVRKGMPEASRALPLAVLERGDAITIAPVNWLWNGWLAAGKLHLIGGQPGTGKTTIALDLAATVTTGGRWPDGTRAQRGSVVIWSGEDDPSDTLAPRLLAAGADMSRVHIVTGVREGGDIYPFDPAHDTESLCRALAGIEDLRLIVVDPLVSAVAGDSHKNAEVRRGLQPLVDLAQATRCALLGITHFSKNTGGREPVERITGSLAFGALARVVLVTAKREAEEDTPATSFLARAKSNIGPDGGGYVYGIKQNELSNSGISASVILWGEALEGTARALLDDAERQDDEARDAVTFLRELLAGGPLPVKEVKRQAEGSGFAWRTVQRAMKSADVESRRGGFGQPATWKLRSCATSTTVAPFAPNNLCGATGATDVTNVETAPIHDE
ncbi:AAA family ATPase [Edaphobacter sp.]|uniref:AAA family ATPase n=1 Tax=Edaphobacter sp. TaxID=1934404 RepID=UPI002DB869FA|nr:AAA family ATPase [Edaphobacter sp.]HEU5340157.1 AAA family ATPase [Edaphobacter sp.]